MRILVTGSSGLLGAAVVRELRGVHDVMGLDLSPADTTTHTGSVTDRENVFELMRGGIDAVVHTASLHAAHLESHSPQDFVETNIHGTMNLLAAAVRSGVKRVVYTSTTSLYGHAMESREQAVWVTEELPPRPRDVYDVTKIAAEHLCAVASRRHGITCLSLRVSRFFPEPQRLIAIYRLYRGVDLRDAVTAHAMALTAPVRGYDAFNISAKTPFTRDQVWRLKHAPEKLLRAMFPWIEGAFSRRDWALPDSIDRVYVTERAEQVLDYRPRYGLVQYLQDLGDDVLRTPPKPDEPDTLWP